MPFPPCLTAFSIVYVALTIMFNDKSLYRIFISDSLSARFTKFSWDDVKIRINRAGRDDSRRRPAEGAAELFEDVST